MPESATATGNIERSADLAADRASEPKAWRAALFAAVVILAPLPLFTLHLRSVWLFRPQYQVYPLLVPALAWLLWRGGLRFSELPRSSWWSNGLLASGLLALALGGLFVSPWLGAVAMVLSVGGLLGRHAIPEKRRGWLAAWLLLWLIVPPPFGWDFQLLGWLQSSSMQTASGVLDALGVRHLLEGQVLVVSGQRLWDDEAGSMVLAVPLLLTSTAIWVVGFRRPALWASLLLASSLAWAWLGKVVYVVTVALKLAWHHVDMSSGRPQEMLAWTTILLALVGLASTDRWLVFLLGPIAPRTSDFSLHLASDSPLNRAWNWLVNAADQTSGRRRVGAGRRPGRTRPAKRPRPGETPPLAQGASRPRDGSRIRELGWPLAFGLIGMLHFMFGLFLLVAGADSPALVPSADRPMPAELLGWTLKEQELVSRRRGDPAGQFSERWRYGREGLVAQISIDYPVPKWNDSTECYTAKGWAQTARRVVTDERADEPAGSVVEVELSKSTGECGWLLFGRLAPGGEETWPSNGTWPRVVARLESGSLGRGLVAWGEAGLLQAGSRMQVFVTGLARLSPKQQAEVRSLFVAARSQVGPSEFRRGQPTEHKR